MAVRHTCSSCHHSKTEHAAQLFTVIPLNDLSLNYVLFMHRIFQPANPYLMQKTFADNVHEPSYKCGYIFMHTHAVHMCHPRLLPSILPSTHQLSFPPPPDLLIVPLTFLKYVINAFSFIHFVPLHYVSPLMYTAETALTQPMTVLETVCHSYGPSQEKEKYLHRRENKLSS